MTIAFVKLQLRQLKSDDSRVLNFIETASIHAVDNSLRESNKVIVYPLMRNFQRQQNATYAEDEIGVETLSYNKLFSIINSSFLKALSGVSIVYVSTVEEREVLLDLIGSHVPVVLIF